MTHRYLPSDVTSDIHQIIAKAIHARLARTGPIDGVSLTFSRAELEAAQEAEFEYDILDDGSILFQPARD